MTSLTRSSITGLYHPKRSITSSTSLSSLSEIDDQSFSSPTRKKSSAVDRILNADKSGFLPTDSSRSSSNLELSNSSSSSSSVPLDQSVLEAQIKRAISCNETMEASIKRLRTETEYSTKDLMSKNESLERSLHEARIKIAELEYSLDKAKQQTITAADTVTPISVYEQQIKTLQNEKLELKLQVQQNQTLHTEEVTQLEKTINNFKHQLVDRDNQLQLSQFDQETLQNINKNNGGQLNEKNEQLEQLQKRVIELELIMSTMNPSNTINQSLAIDVKQINQFRYENDRLKKEIELLKLKCNERSLHAEELRILRKQVDSSQNYRAVIARQEAEILNLREQLANENRNDLI